MTAQAMALRFGQAARIQMDLLRRLGRARAIIAGCALAAIAIEILQLRLKSADASPATSLEYLTGLRFLIVAVFALFWGASVWRGEGPKNRQYFLSQPVDASVHELSRLAAGAAWMAAAIVSVILVSLIGALAKGDAGTLAGPLPWIGLFTGPLLIYMAAGSIATLTSRVAEVLIFGYLAIVVIIPMAALWGVGQSIGKIFNAIIVGSYGLRAALFAPRTADGPLVLKWIAATVIWYVVAGLMIAAVLWWRRGRLATR